MKKHVVVSILCIILAIFTLLWGLNPIASTHTQVSGGTIALLLDTDIGAGALQMKQGAKQAAKEQKVELLLATADYAKSAAQSQAELMLKLLSLNVKAVLLVPVQGADLSEPLKEAERREIPVLTLGEAPLLGGTACTISANHEEAGALAAKALLDRLKEPGHALLLTGDTTDHAAALRKTGAMKVLSSKQDFQILQETSLSGKSADDVLAILQGNTQINCILALTGQATETSALAMGRYTVDIPLVGMDCGQNRNLYLENGQVDAMVLGMPFAMGYLGVQFAMQALGSKDIPDWYFTQSRVIDSENMYLPENQKLAFPLLQ